MAPASGDWEKQLAEHCGQPRLERFHQRRGPGATDCEPLLGAAAADLGLDGVHRLQAFDHLVSERRLRRLDTSTNLRRACARQKASRIAPP